MTISINDLTITKYAGNPVLSPNLAAGSPDYYGIRNQVGFYEDGIYYLVYWAQPTGDWLTDANAGCFLAYTKDRTLQSGWTKVGILLETQAAYYPSGSILKVGSTYYMFLVYAPAGADQSQLGTSLATASSMTGPWTLYNSGTPLISLATNFCCNGIIGAPPASGYTWMMFGCRVAAADQIRYCYSDDLLTWTGFATAISTAALAGYIIENFFPFKVGENWYGALFCYDGTGDPSILTNDADTNGIYLYQATNATLTTWEAIGWLATNSANGTDWDASHVDFPTIFSLGDKIKIIYAGGANTSATHTGAGFGQQTSLGLIDVSGFPLPDSPMPTFYL